MFYNLTKNENNETTLTLVFSDGETKSLSESHPAFAEVKQKVIVENSDNEAEIRDVIDVVPRVGQRLTALSERVRVSDTTLYFDGDALDDAISQHIIRLYQDEDERGWRALVNFLEKVSTNPSQDSRESLYTWLRRQDFTITPDGDFIAYKGVLGGEDGAYVSVHSGYAIVDGKPTRGRIPNNIGSVITMPRSQVDDDTGVGCSTGLHAGTRAYAQGFVGNGVILHVKINPRDVVSVPRDCNYQKLRTSRYEVLEVSHYEIETPYYDPDNSDEYDEDGYDENGYDEDGYDHDGYDVDGYDEDGFDEEGFDEDDYNRDGRDAFGYNRDGIDRNGNDVRSLSPDGKQQNTPQTSQEPEATKPADDEVTETVAEDQSPIEKNVSWRRTIDEALSPSPILSNLVDKALGTVQSHVDSILDSLNERTHGNDNDK